MIDMFGTSSSNFKKRMSRHASGLTDRSFAVRDRTGEAQVRRRFEGHRVRLVVKLVGGYQFGHRETRHAVPKVHHEDAGPAVGHRRIEPHKELVHIGIHVIIDIGIQSQVGIGEGREVEPRDPRRIRTGGGHRILDQLEAAEIGPFPAGGITSMGSVLLSKSL